MKDKLCFSQPPRRPVINFRSLLLVTVAGLTLNPCAWAADAPSWMHALVNAPLPEHNEKTEAILMYSETSVTVVAVDKIRTQFRKAYKILRPEGREHGTVRVYLNSQRKVKSLHGWCIPAQGKDYEVKDKDSLEMSPPMIAGIELMQDVKLRVLHIPAPDPGNIVGFEYEVEEEPFFLQDSWGFQTAEPVRESHYMLQIPSGWEYKASWVNHPEVKPTEAGKNQWQWALSDLKALRHEPNMPPFNGVRGQMIVTFFPPGGGATNSFADWNAMGRWYTNLLSTRVEASPQIKQQVAALTGGKMDNLQKMQTLARFVQHDVRYVAIELGIGGWQPHPASEVFTKRYGDCKDKATLLRSMLHEIGIDAYQVVIYTERGAITPETPANHGFNHAIDAIRIPDGVANDSLVAALQHPKLGRLLFFDPTDDVTPFGQIRGALQANYGLLVTPDGGELVELPQQPSAMNSIQRTAKLSLTPDGTLKGDVEETRLGDRARFERAHLLAVTKDTDQIKPVENLLSNSLSSFRITNATVLNLHQWDQPFGWKYTFEAQNYAKNSGNLLLVRPRVIGNKGMSILETKEPRVFPIEFDGPARDTDVFEIAIPDGYVVDDLPPPVDADYSFASYHAKTEVANKVVRYSRTFEQKELSVPVARADELKKFYRMIASDERSMVVLKADPK